MDTKAAGAQFATKSHTTTIDLQAEIIANQQKEIDRLNVLAVDNAAEIVRLKETVKWYQGNAGKLMGAVARAEIDAAPVEADDDEIALLKRQIHNLKRHIAEYCPAAPAAPSEQAEPSVKPQGQGTENQRNAVYTALHYYMKIAQPDEWAGTDAAIAAFLAAAPAAPLPAQPEALATITLGGIEGDELGNIDIEIIDMKRLEALQYQMVRTEDPVYLHLYAHAVAAPLPELTGPSIGDDRKFCRLARAWDVAEHGEGDNAVKTLEALVAYIDSRSAASPSPAPAPTEPQELTLKDLAAQFCDSAESGAPLTISADSAALLFAAMTTPPDDFVPPLVAAPVSQRDAGSVVRFKVDFKPAFQERGWIEVFGQEFGIEGVEGHRFAVHNSVERVGEYTATHLETGFVIGHGETPEYAIELGRKRWLETDKESLSLKLMRARNQTKVSGGRVKIGEQALVEVSASSVPRMGGDTKTSDAATSPASRVGGITSTAKDAAIALWNATGEQLQSADDTLRALSSYVGQGGCWDTENLDYEEMAARIKEGIDVLVKVAGGGITSKESAETAAPGASIGDDPEFDKLAEAWGDLIIKASSPTSFDMYDKKLAEARAALAAFLDRRAGAGTGDRQ